MSQKRNKNQRDKETAKKKHDKVEQAVKNEKNKLNYVMSDEQVDNLDDIQRITQEELQYVLENLEEYEGLSQEQIHGKVTIRIRERCAKELGMEIGH